MKLIKKQFIQQALIPIVDLFFPLKCLKCQKIINKQINKYKQNNKTGFLPGYPLDYLAEQSFSENLFRNFFCSDCITLSYEPFIPPFCKRCGKKFEYIEYKQTENHFCEDCLKTSNGIGKVRAGAHYSGIVKKSIQYFKYQKKLSLAKPLERIIFKGFTQYFNPSEVDILMPVPLHISKLKQRGFNQAFLVVKNFKKIMRKKNIASQLEVDLYSLKRVKKTDPQTNFSAEQRKENVKNAFKVMNREKIKNKKILIVDDVYTTGATSTEAAFELLSAGAASVDVLVIARA
ncbi:MAG: ComF family protein [Desulfobacteraceae bacterium]|nr:ComF family protein [Desulfobacteraceae bacterium]